MVFHFIEDYANWVHDIIELNLLQHFLVDGLFHIVVFIEQSDLLIVSSLFSLYNMQ